MKSKLERTRQKCSLAGFLIFLIPGCLSQAYYGGEKILANENFTTKTLPPEELKQAAIGFVPLILFRKISSTEYAIGTRSHNTLFDIQIVMSSTGYGSKDGRTWKYGDSPLDSNFHLALIHFGQFSTSVTFPPNAEKMARQAFAECNEIIQRTNSKFMSMSTLRAAADGEAEILIAKVIHESGTDSKKRLNLDILKNLSGKKIGKVNLKSGLKTPLERDSIYFIGYKKALFSGKVIEAKMVLPEERDSIEKMYAIRLEIMKQPWTKSLAEP